MSWGQVLYSEHAEHSRIPTNVSSLSPQRIFFAYKLFFSASGESQKDWSGTNPDQSWPHILVKSGLGHPLRLTSRSWLWDLTGRTIENPGKVHWVGQPGKHVRTPESIDIMADHAHNWDPMICLVIDRIRSWSSFARLSYAWWPRSCCIITDHSNNANFEWTTVKSRIIEQCAMSLELPPLVRSGVFLFFYDS